MKNRNRNYIIMQRLHTHIIGNRSKRTFIENIRMFSHHVKPFKPFVRIKNLEPHFFIPEKGYLTKLNGIDLLSERWYDQFNKISRNKIYILYAQLIFADIPFVFSYKIIFMYTVRGDYCAFLKLICNLILSETEKKFKINAIYDRYLDSWKSDNLFYQARLVSKPQRKYGLKRSERKRVQKNKIKRKNEDDGDNNNNI